MTKKIVLSLFLTIFNNAFATTLKYEIISENECIVIGAEQLEDELIIPESCIIDGKTYKIVDIRCLFSYTNLKTVIIKPNIKIIYGSMFADCHKLQNITLPNSITEIGFGAFLKCYHLKSIKLPEQLEKIDKMAFHSCMSLTSLTIPNGVEELPADVFAWCNNLTSIKFGKSCKIIGYHAFRHCSSLTNLVIPNWIKIIDESAFAECESLVNVSIGNNVRKINYGAFEDCHSLQTVTFTSENPPLAPNNIYSIFSYKAIKHIKIYVPASSIAKYEETEFIKSYMKESSHKINPIKNN